MKPMRFNNIKVRIPKCVRDGLVKPIYPSVEDSRNILVERGIEFKSVLGRALRPGSIIRYKGKIILIHGKFNTDRPHIQGPGFVRRRSRLQPVRHHLSLLGNNMYIK